MLPLCYAAPQSYHTLLFLLTGSQAGDLHCSFTTAFVVIGTVLGRAAFYCSQVLKVVIGNPLSFKWEETVIEGGL